MHVTVMQGTHLGNHLTMPYHKNATKPLLHIASMDKYGIAVILH